ncbi:hypothetical protein [Lentilactobacillus sp. SPB1-3]|uniref:Uncharacterized protein n=1 Tax=Lentilactobacillus terminaliae TaxID=3003483 RepID=A0ACD5DEV1_9LACO|nr:hypothetical protein [Lentilactobacillus sp. SPB1-3]MCZ0976456.1 hypothetical protein [Lentilactobacillus sp. SPB1-3]
MNKSERIVKFTFWTNNLMSILIGMIMFLTFTMNGWFPIRQITIDALAIIAVFVLVVQIYYLRVKMNIPFSKWNNIYYFTEDERDENNANRVNSILAGQDYQFWMYIIGIIPVLMYGFYGSALLMMRSLIILFSVGTISINIRYKSLWNKMNS